MCRNHSHLAAVPLGQVVLTPHGWMQSWRVVQDLKIELPTGDDVIYPPGTVFYVPCQDCEDSVPLDTPLMGGPTDVPPSWMEDEPTFTATMIPFTTRRSAN